MFEFIRSLFGIDTVVNTATKIIEKIAGTDWTAKEKADWILRYQDATKHQSLARRFIAILVSFVYSILIATLAVSYIVGNVTSSPEILMIAKDIKMLMKDLILEPFNYIIMFYFALGAINSIKK